MTCSSDRQFRRAKAQRRIGPRHFFAAALALALAAVVLGSITAGSSGARFTAVSSNPGAVFSSGTMTLVSTADGSAVVSAGALAPGASVSGTLTLTNEGNLGASVTLAKTSLDDQPSSPSLSSALTLTIAETAVSGTRTLYTGTMSDFGEITLDPFSPSESRDYRFSVTFPETNASPDLQGASTTMTIRFRGVAQ
jgi:hypothetical protein